MKVPTWYQLRSVGRSPISRMTVLMPVIGYFILFGDFTSSLFSIVGQRIGLADTEAEEFTVNSLHFIYFGVLSFSISTIVYNIFCPDVIKIFSNRYEFFSQELAVITMERAKAINLELKEVFNLGETFIFDDRAGDQSEKGSTRNDADGEKLERMRNAGVRSSREHWLSKHSGPVSNLLHKKYELYDNSGFGIRTFVFFSYLVSTLLMAIPTLTTATQIVLSLFN